MVQKISLMDAYLIETLRNAGISDEEILSKTERKKLEDFQQLHESFDFTELYPRKNILKSILETGYKVKFLTFPGLVNLIQLKYGKYQDRDFKVKEYTVTDLKLTNEEKEDIKAWLSSNWQVEEGNGGIEIKPVKI